MYLALYCYRQHQFGDKTGEVKGRAFILTQKMKTKRDNFPIVFKPKILQ